jgi:SAM-dependent MidA family methyltransferase
MSIVEKGVKTKMEEHIRKKIEGSLHKRISYAEYMQLALYDEQYGYYMKNEEKIGRAGDFITTSNVSNVVAQLFTKIFVQLIEAKKIPPFICEMGGGTGRFARAVLEEWQRLSPATFASGTYFLIEVSPYHRQKQQEMLQMFAENVQLLERIDQLPPRFSGIVFSNEFFDAFPVHVIEKENEQLYELFVTVGQNGLTEQKIPLENEEIIGYLRERNISLNNGQRFEVPLAMKQFIFDLDQRLEKAFIFTVDYGYTDEEWKEPARQRGSLRGYYKHRLMDDPLCCPGEMDLTTHIQWDALRYYGERVGWTFVDLWRQDQFLLKAGILHYFIEHRDPNPFSEQSRHNRAIRSLILDGGIGSAFQVMLQQKNVQIDSGDIFK